MLYRYRIEEFSRADLEKTGERFRELGLEGWELVSVLPGGQQDPDAKDRLLCWFKRDATSDIGL